MRELAARRGVDIAFVANQFAIQRTRAATTVVGTGRWSHVVLAIRASETQIDDELVADLLALRAPESERPWVLGLSENGV